ncbi:MULTISPECIES: hypothetical protein [unclassified Arthrobacter]|uniref:hypothetical protein n=1 Tax=unclassified Arthrobacter TaxID=235627 RepID=UPI002104F73F|nr:MULTISPECIES: hypothetical protein [unclassified Arthrobacter]MCQ1945512.1 hypothetical protein [Arthrobacter sp. zg-Y1116]MCQ1994827.1 hypothetical protein [Arthrobacter sp. zg-Y1171]UWX81106.1 hypothetical protein N2L00_11925 [Arthrobacter sp. zg-Y1171]
MTDSNLNAAVQRLVEAKKQAMVRKLEIEVAREHAEIEWRAEYEPVVRKVALGVAYDVVHVTVAEVSKWLLTEDEVGERLADALREHHSVADPLVSEIVATVRSVLSALVADIEIVDESGDDSDARPLVP